MVRDYLAIGLDEIESSALADVRKSIEDAVERNDPGLVFEVVPQVALLSMARVGAITSTLRTKFGEGIDLKRFESALKSEHERLRQSDAAERKAKIAERPGLPQVFANNRQLRDYSADALSALQKSNDPPYLFVRSGRMVAVNQDERARHVITEIDKDALRGWMTRSANYYRISSKGEAIEVPPPLEAVVDILARPAAEWQFQPLDAVVEAPVLRPDGTILDRPGYDAATCLFYAPDEQLQIPAVPERPSADEIEFAISLLLKLIADFPFVGRDDEECPSRANMIGLLLTPVVKPAINAPTPIGLLDAPAAGSGKSLLADVVSIIATGNEGQMFSAPRDEDEWRKQLTTALLSGSQIVVIDNIVRRLDNPELCKVLTETLHADRAFHTQSKLVLPVRCVFIGTGNNIQVGGDMPRRCYRIRIDPETSRPFQREGFMIPDLKAWTKQHRGELLAALLTLARAWYAAGRPKPKRPPLGSYEAWSTTVGGILEYAGIGGFMRNAEDFYEEADVESIEWESFLLALDEVFYGEPFTVAQLVEKLKQTAWNDHTKRNEPTVHALRLQESMPGFLAEMADRDGSFRNRMGKRFSAMIGTRFGKSEVYLDRGQVVHSAQSWIVTSGHRKKGSFNNPCNKLNKKELVEK